MFLNLLRPVPELLVQFACANFLGSYNKRFADIVCAMTFIKWVNAEWLNLDLLRKQHQIYHLLPRVIAISFVTCMIPD